MNRPEALVKLAGSPVGACVLLSGCAFAMYTCYQGQLTWWWGLIAAFLAVKVLGSYSYMRSYKAWRAEWDAAAAPQEARLPKKNHGGRLAIVAALMMLLSFPEILAQLGQEPGTQLYDALRMAGWGGALFLALTCLYFVFRLFRGVWRWLPKPKRSTKAEAPAIVTLAVGASSSPSLSEAKRNLPEYAQQLLREK